MTKKADQLFKPGCEEGSEFCLTQWGTDCWLVQNYWQNDTSARCAHYHIELRYHVNAKAFYRCKSCLEYEAVKLVMGMEDVPSI